MTFISGPFSSSGEAMVAACRDSVAIRAFTASRAYRAEIFVVQNAWSDWTLDTAILIDVHFVYNSRVLHYREEARALLVSVIGPKARVPRHSPSEVILAKRIPTASDVENPGVWLSSRLETAGLGANPLQACTAHDTNHVVSVVR